MPTSGMQRFTRSTKANADFRVKLNRLNLQRCQLANARRCALRDPRNSSTLATHPPHCAAPARALSVAGVGPRLAYEPGGALES